MHGDDGLVHMFASEITNDCGILHYCSNSQVVHLTARHALGPYLRRGVALAPRMPPAWDSGAIHGPTIHRVRTAKNSSIWALYYMGTSNTWDPAGASHPSHPNCSVRVDPQMGDHASRRLGLATAPSLFGPWTRRDSPLFGPGDAGQSWDWSDVSNVTPIILANGTTVLLYKGRGHVQAMGVARGRAFDGPFVRTSPLAPVLGWRVEDTWGWVQPADAVRGTPEVLHVLSHVGNGGEAAGGHAWSLDGTRWIDTTAVPMGVPAYTGRVHWANGSSTILLRRERPQALLLAAPSAPSSVSDAYGEPSVVCTSAQPMRCAQDGGPPDKTRWCRSFTMCDQVDLRDEAPRSLTGEWVPRTQRL